MDDGLHHPRHHVVPEHGVTSYMARVQAVLAGDEPLPEVHTVTRAPRSLADANDEWVSQRALAEQVLSEANAVMPPGRQEIELYDEVGQPRLSFVLRGQSGWVRVTMQHDKGLAWLGCEGSIPGLTDGLELADPMALESVVLHLL